MPLQLYSGHINNTHTEKTSKEYTHALSHVQAVRNLCTRFPYPPYVLEDINNEVTGVSFTKEEFEKLYVNK